jgi:hypothetical protein
VDLPALPCGKHDPGPRQSRWGRDRNRAGGYREATASVICGFKSINRESAYEVLNQRTAAAGGPVGSPVRFRPAAAELPDMAACSVSLMRNLWDRGSRSQNPLPVYADKAREWIASTPSTAETETWGWGSIYSTRDGLARCARGPVGRRLRSRPNYSVRVPRERPLARGQ